MAGYGIPRSYRHMVGQPLLAHTVPD
jgi:hypothetical protein